MEETLIYPIPKDTQFVCIRREKVTVSSNGDVEAVQEVVEDELVEEVEADEIQMAAAASEWMMMMMMMKLLSVEKIWKNYEKKI